MCNHKKKLSLRHPLPTFDSFSFFKADLGSIRYFKNQQNFIKVSSDIYFNVVSWFPGNACVKHHFTRSAPVPPQLPLQHEPCKGWHELSLELQCAQHVSDWLTRSVFAKCTPFCHCLMYLGCVQIRCRKVGRPPIKSHHKHFHLIRWIAGLVKRIKLEGNKLNFKWDFMIDAMYHYYLCGINNQLLPMYSMNHKLCMSKDGALFEGKKC